MNIKDLLEDEVVAELIDNYKFQDVFLKCDDKQCTTLLYNTLQDVLNVNPFNYMTAINDKMFKLSLFTTLVIPDNITYVGSSAFAFSSKLSSVELHCKGAVYSNAFLCCPVLSRVVVGRDITFLAFSAFFDCPKLNTIIYLGTVELFKKLCSGAVQTWLRYSLITRVNCIDGAIVRNNGVV